MRQVKVVAEVVMDAYWRLAEDDGWAIASHLAMSTLTSMFPFLIFVTALAGFIGSTDLSEAAANLLFDVWPRQVAAPIAHEIHMVLTTAHGGLLTIGACLALYFSSSGVEAFRIGLNRAYGVRERRTWWVLRLESIAYVLVGAVALLALAFLVVLAPLIWTAIVAVAPEFERLSRLVTFARYGLASILLVAALIIAHKWLPADRRSFVQIAPGIILTVVLSLGVQHGVRRLSLGICAQLCDHLRRPRFGDDRLAVSLRAGQHLRLRRRAECCDHPTTQRQRSRAPHDQQRHHAVDPAIAISEALRCFLEVGASSNEPMPTRTLIRA